MKTMTTMAATIVLAALPTLSLAMGCSYENHQQQAMSCAEGTVWDAQAGACVEQITS